MCHRLKLIGALTLLIIIFSLTPPAVYAAPTRRIYHTGTNSGSYGCYYGTAWQEQSFTVGGTGFSVTSVKLMLWRTSASLGTATASIRAVDANHKPTGSDLASGTYSCDSITQTETAGTLYEFTFTPYTLAANTEYAIVLRQSAGSPANTLWWVHTHKDYTTPYADGMPKYSYDSGSTWGDTINRDLIFEVWGEDAGSSYSRTITGSVDIEGIYTNSAAYTRSITGSITTAATISTLIHRMITIAATFILTGDVTLSKILTIVFNAPINVDVTKSVYGVFDISELVKPIPPILVNNNIGLYLAMVLIIIISIVAFTRK